MALLLAFLLPGVT